MVFCGGLSYCNSSAIWQVIANSVICSCFYSHHFQAGRHNYDQINPL